MAKKEERDSKGFIERIILGAIALTITDYLSTGFNMDNFMVAVGLAVVLSITSKLLKPLLEFISFPLTILTLGLFQLVINGIVFYVTCSFFSTIEITSLTTAILCALVISVLYSALGIDE